MGTAIRRSPFEAVDKVDSLSQKCKHFFEEMQAAASHGAAFLAAPHVCGLSSVFSDAHVAGKNNLISFRHLRMTELCEALAQDLRHFYFFDKLTPGVTLVTPGVCHI